MTTHTEPPTLNHRDWERYIVYQAMEKHQWNRTHAARELAMHERTLQRKLKAWGWQDRRANGEVEVVIQ